MNIENGKEIIEFDGIVNLEQVRVEALQIADKYRDIILEDNNIKEAKKIVKELKEPRKEIKSYRAAVNKFLTAAKKSKLADIDDITAIFNDVLQPLENKINMYTEEIKARKLAAKKSEFQEQIEKNNEDLKTISENLPYFEYTAIHFNDEWANKSITAISNELNKQIENQRFEIERKIERIENIKTNCRLFKTEYELAGDIDWEQLRERIYQDNWKELLENMAMTQQTQELAAIERAEERMKREEERKEEEKQRQLEKERRTKEEEERKKLEEKKLKVEPNEEKKITYTLKITSSKTKALQLKEYLTNNNIEYTSIK